MPRLTTRTTAASILLALGLALSLALPTNISASSADDRYWDDSFVSHGPNQFTDAIVHDHGTFYMGGNFKRVGEIDVKYIARWIGGEDWEKLGAAGGVGTWDMGLVHTIARHDMTLPDQSTRRVLFVGGMFDQIQKWRTNNIALYDIDANVWQSLGDGTNRAVRKVVVGNNGDVYVAGEFTEADGQPAQAVARYDGNRWYPLGTGLEVVDSPRGGGGTGARAMALAVYGDGVFVGGMFDVAGGVSANHVAYWDGTRFHALGDGVNGFVNTMTLVGSKLYVGGDFNEASGRIVNAIARWDIESERWSAVGSGFGRAGMARVRTIMPYGKWIYVGGEFSYAGSQAVNNIARWDGQQWHPLGSGVDDEVKVITCVNDMLYVGGNFEAAGGKQIGFLTRWLGTALEFEAFSASRGDDGVTLSWRLATGIPVTRYHVYRDGERIATIENAAGETVAAGGVATASQYTDTNADPQKRYSYSLGVERAHGLETRSGVVRASVPPTGLDLAQNYPNPFNPSTTIEFTSDGALPVRLTIHDLRGARVAVLYDATPVAGTVTIDWDGASASGTRASTGVYFYRLESAGNVLTRKMVLLK